MLEHSTTERAKNVLAVVAATLEQRAGDLSALDAALGDGDHGVSLTIGFRKVMEVMQAPDLPDVSALLQRVGMTLLNSVGGAMGPLFGVAFIRAGQAAAGWGDGAREGAIWRQDDGRCPGSRRRSCASGRRRGRGWPGGTQRSQ